MMLVSIVASCVDNSHSGYPIASVGDKILTSSDVAMTLPPNTTAADSVVLVNDYVRNWVHEQVMLQKAQINLADEEKDIQDAIEQYRTALLVDRYQRKVLDQKFHPNITEEEIEEYYKQQSSSFLLTDNIMMGMMAILPKSAPKISKLRSQLKEISSDNYSEIEQYLYLNATKYILSFDKWTSASSLTQYIPKELPFNELQAIKSHQVVELSDEQYTYIFLANEHILEGQTAPVEYVHDKIFTILLNKKKIQFIKSLEGELYNEAMKNNLIKYYVTK
ncbi:MAG: hypothetical protein Q4C30_09090 [Bacteroidia bacterium]|nr:hypothetical protein [Bacteroidia bacterium]